MKAFLTGLAKGLLSLIGAFLAGKIHEKKKQAEHENKELRKDAKVAARPRKRGRSLTDSL